jgi:hypothetical protein
MMTDTPTPEAIVKAALERAADTLMCNCKGDCEWPAQCPQHDVEAILALASDQAEVAQIIQNAGGQTDPYLYAVGYDVGFEDGFKEAQGRVKELEADNKGLRHMILDQINSTGDDPKIMAATRAEWAARAKDAEAKLAKAVEAQEYYKDKCERGIKLFPNGKSAATTFAELKGDSDEQTTDSNNY